MRHNASKQMPLFEALLWLFAAAVIVFFALFVLGMFVWLLPVLMVVWILNFLNRVAPKRK